MEHNMGDYELEKMLAYTGFTLSMLMVLAILIK